MKSGTVLITGGAGYIGSHIILACQEASYPVVVLDDLSKGHRRLVPEGAAFYQGDVGDRRLVAEIIRRHAVTAVIHLAGAVVVPESMTAPLAYYQSNTCKSRSLLQSCVENDVGRFVFSSTAAVYGEPDAVPVSEDAPTRPASPYGASKLMVEWMLRDAARAHGLRHVILRYFNVAGADRLGRAGQATVNATHLIKVVCEAAVGKRREIEIFGHDYDTRDGTCVRDFVHVSDLAAAHLSALEHLLAGGASCTLNCGYGRGFSVREVLDMVGRVAGRPLAVERAPRRPGDPAEVIAAVGRIRDLLRWQPRHDDLEQIVRDALRFERQLPARPDS